jgi:hypothetical protein
LEQSSKVETRKDIAVKKRTLVVILIILAVMAVLWLTRQETIHTGAEEPTAQVTSCLIALDEVQQQAAASAAAQEATPQPESAQQTAAPAQTEATIDEFGAYTSKDDVCAYLIAYGHLPENFMTKSDARDLGWSGGDWTTMPTASVSAGITLATTKVYCRSPAGGNTPSAT